MLKETFLPENTRNGYLLKFWENTIKPFHRQVFEHSHLQFEIVIFKSGSGIYTTKKGKYDIAPNDIFVFSSNEQHCISDVYEGEEFSFTNLQFEPRYVWGSKNNGFSNEAVNICFSHNEDFCSRLPRDNPYTKKIAGLMGEIEQEFHEKNAEYELMIHNKVYEILIILARHLNYGIGKTVTPHEYGQIKCIRSAMEYINRHLSEEITLQGVADKVNLSPNYFSHIFKSTMGISLWDYIISKRIENAITLISQQQDKNMLDIAVQCGFNNTANFNKMFRRITGITPSEFRKQGTYIG